VQEKHLARARPRCTTCSVPWGASGQARRGMAVSCGNNVARRDAVDPARAAGTPPAPG